MPPADLQGESVDDYSSWSYNDSDQDPPPATEFDRMCGIHALLYGVPEATKPILYLQQNLSWGRVKNLFNPS